MKNNFIVLGLLAMLTFASCKQDISTEDITQQDLSDLESQQIKDLGFSPKGAVKEDGEYIVEGDIRLTAENLKSKDAAAAQFLRVGDEEQYRTTNLVTGLPRTIKVFVSTALPATYVSSVDVALARYNALPLTIKFQRVTTGAYNIVINKSPSTATYLASAGFPSGGNPYNQVLINSTYLGSTASTTFYNYVGTILAHEIGHCIGFRHTDYYNRAISCGGATANEGASTVGAILVPGTPSTATNAANSWMLACISANQNRPFNSADIVALNYLY
jgi:Dual-action HEIGH metallo-peptidase